MKHYCLWTCEYICQAVEAETDCSKYGKLLQTCFIPCPLVEQAY